MTIAYTVRPHSDLTAFNTETRKPNPFRATWSDTLKLLSHELGHLKAKDVVFEIDCREADVRNDGMLYARAKVTHPGVRIAFDSIHGPLTYATDRYAGRWSDDPPAWQINVRAIALGLEALRAVDRYGITSRAEQYTGFKAIGGGNAMPASHMTADAARDLLDSFVNIPISVQSDEQAALQRAYRIARAASHPDRNAGDRTRWDRVEQAAAVLGLLR